MTIEVRAARADEMDQFGLIGAYVYAGAFGDGPDNVVSQNNRPEWTLCAFDGTRMAASYSCLPFTMRANGQPSRWAASARSARCRISAARSGARDHDAVVRRHARARASDRRTVGVTGSHLSTLRLRAVERAGDAIGSTPSTSGSPTATADPRASPRVEPDAGFEILKKVYIDFVAQRMCYLHRAKPLWMNTVLSSDAATGPAHIAVAYGSSGAPTGYVIYHVRDDKTGHPTRRQELS